MRRRSGVALAASCLLGLSACVSPGALRIEPAARTDGDLVYDQNARRPGALGAPLYQVLDAEGNVVFTPGRHPSLAQRVACVPTAVERVEASRKSWRAGSAMLWSGLGLMVAGTGLVVAGVALSQDDGSSVETPLRIGGAAALLGGAFVGQAGLWTRGRAQLRVLDAVNAYNDQRSQTPACRP